MDDVALANYIAGSFFGNVSAGHTDQLLARLLGVASGTEIWLSDYTLTKLHDKHGYINFSHYHHMPSLLLYGFVARGRKVNLAELWWVDESDADSTSYQVVLKATKSGEVYLETFHRIHLKEARRLARKASKDGRLIRVQAGFENLAKLRK